MFNPSQLEGFEWDRANIDKNQLKHNVHFRECEQVFGNTPLLLSFDKIHSKLEIRFYVLGRTDDNRSLFIVFTVRDNKIRIVSARHQSRKERKIYEQAKTI